jgi:hypothetical protein
MFKKNKQNKSKRNTFACNKKIVTLSYRSLNKSDKDYIINETRQLTGQLFRRKQYKRVG